MIKQLFPYSVNNPAPNLKTSTVVTDFGFMDNDTEILDIGLGSSGCFPLGFKRTDIIDNVCEKLKTASFCQSDFATTNNYVDELSNKLHELSGGYDVIYTMSGSDAVETSIKIAQLYGNDTHSNRKTIIGFVNSYHGSTFMSSSISGSTYLTDVCGRYEHSVTINYNELDRIDNTVLAVVIETCSWQNGLEIFPGQFWKDLRKKCTDNNVLLIIDDIAFCSGKTNTLFGWQTLGIEPDIFTIGKGITGGYFPLSATLFNKKVSDVIRERVLLHGFSYSFPMAGILSTLEYLKVLENENVFKNYSHIIDSMNDVSEELLKLGLISGYRHFGVCYNLLLNKPFYELWRKEEHFYKHGLHMGLWNNYSDGVLVMVPLNATPEYFFQLKAKMFQCLSTLYKAE